MHAYYVSLEVSLSVVLPTGMSVFRCLEDGVKQLLFPTLELLESAQCSGQGFKLELGRPRQCFLLSCEALCRSWTRCCHSSLPHRTMRIKWKKENDYVALSFLEESRIKRKRERFFKNEF